MGKKKYDLTGILASASNSLGVEPLAVDMATGASLIGMSRRSLENYCNLRLIESRKVGRRRVVIVRSLKKFLGQDQPSASPPRGRKPELAEGEQP